MKPPNVTALELHRQISTGARVVLVDVRTDEEFESGGISEAIHLPLHDLGELAYQVLPDIDAPIVVYCAHGIRSAQALRMLRQIGYSNVSHLESGIVEWIAQGLPVTVSKQVCEVKETAERYHRQLILESVGIAGQKRLADARVLLVGIGGLGSPAAMYLAGAGVGTLGLVDSDVVGLSNLHRQLIYGTDQIGTRKVESARQRLSGINPNVKVIPTAERLGSTNASSIIEAGWDVVLDGTDNFSTRYVLNDAAMKQKIPVCYGAIDRFEGQVTTFLGHQGPCYRCLFPKPPPQGTFGSCSERGVLGVLPGVIGTLQATEALKLLLKIGDVLSGRLLIYDALSLGFREIRYDRDPSCRTCQSALGR